MNPRRRTELRMECRLGRGSSGLAGRSFRKRHADLPRSSELSLLQTFGLFNRVGKSTDAEQLETCLTGAVGHRPFVPTIKRKASPLLIRLAGGNRSAQKHLFVSGIVLSRRIISYQRVTSCKPARFMSGLPRTPSEKSQELRASLENRATKAVGV